MFANAVSENYQITLNPRDCSGGTVVLAIASQAEG